MSWCEEADVDKILGNIPLSSGTSKAYWMGRAADEMNAYFAGIYDIPITIPSSVASVVSGATTNFLKTINSDLAAGWLLLSMASAHENKSLHSFAKDLEKRSFDRLEKIQAGTIVLTGVTEDTDLSDNVVRSGKILTSSPDGKSENAQSSEDATDEKSYFNRPIDEVGDSSYSVDL